MIVPIRHAEWQLLRIIARAEATGSPPPAGRELRVTMSQRTKDGTFLDDLVEAGLIAVAQKPAPPDARSKDEPPQFRTGYKLTALGRHAAEFGEYDRPFTPGERDVSGRIAELNGLIAAKPFAPAPKKGKAKK